MATAEKTTVEREVITTETDTVVKLELSETEAHALSTLLARVSGHRTNSGREHTDAVYFALAAAGYSYHVSPFDGFVTGSPRFETVRVPRPRFDTYA